MFSDAELEAFLDEALPAEQMARIELLLREQPALREKLAEVQARRDTGLHSLSEIWRRHRISCPSRETWGSFLLGALDPAMAAAMRMHLELVGCRYCQANLADLQSQQTEPAPAAEDRRRRCFDSTSGYLPEGK
ncbi:MAG: hypothetical protein NZ602_15615 [Thermoguttaceae bacterium]|nr:hypothetical protein [Thermoguttaceae bacterium]MDW8038866.1 hypothetical protein [Thermoguttaceae bacterium]